MNIARYFDAAVLKPDMTPEQVEAAIKPETILVSIMFANNEIGTIEPIKEIGEVCRKKGVYFHTDAVQAVGHVKIDVNDMNIDFLSLSGHKLGAPKGIGALYIRKGCKIKNLIHGGQQEKGKRAGTENVIGIVALGKAVELAMEEIDEVTKYFFEHMHIAATDGGKVDVPFILEQD